MSRATLSLVTLALIGSLGLGTGVAKQQPDAASGSARKASQRFATGRVATAPAAQLPNGASSISETYGAWAIACRIANGQKQCLLAHTQTDSHTGQPLFAIELQMSRDGKMEGTLLMPFGLKLDAGAILTVDGEDLGSGLRFSTCVPQGCLIPVSFPKITVDAMKTSKTLTVASQHLGGGEMVSFNVSLEGVAAAIARMSELDP